MNPDNAAELTIRNQRFSRWPAIAATSMLAAFFIGVCGLVTLNAGMPLVLFGAVGTVAALAGAVGLGLFAPPIVTGLKLTDMLQPRPGGPGYLPIDVARIDFAPDPGEDYYDPPLPIRLCEVRVRPVHRLAIRLIASVCDGRRLRDWAVRNGVDLSDPMNVLDDLPSNSNTDVVEPAGP